MIGYKEGEMEEKTSEYWKTLLGVFWVLQERIEIEIEGTNSVLKVAFYFWLAIKIDWVPQPVVSRVKKTKL